MCGKRPCVALSCPVTVARVYVCGSNLVWARIGRQGPGPMKGVGQWSRDPKLAGASSVAQLSRAPVGVGL